MGMLIVTVVAFAIGVLVGRILFAKGPKKPDV